MYLQTLHRPFIDQCWLIVNWTHSINLQWNLNENEIVHSFMNMHLKMSSEKWRPFCQEGRRCFKEHAWWMSPVGCNDRGQSMHLFIKRAYIWLYPASKNHGANMGPVAPIWSPFRPHGSLTKYVKLRGAHALGMPGTISSRYRGLAIPTCITARAVMHAGIPNQWFALKSVARETFPAFPAHAQFAILRIW